MNKNRWQEHASKLSFSIECSENICKDSIPFEKWNLK